MIDLPASDPAEWPEDRPLTGLKIIDLTRLLPGPLATRHLAEWGAEVIKIEGPAEAGQDDAARHMFRTAADVLAGRPSALFADLNPGKTLRTLDLRSPAGREALLALVCEADALIEGFRPGVMEGLGLGWAVLRELNPRLVMCAISGYGQRGPWSRRAGHDLNYIAMSGVLGQIATAEGSVAIPNVQVGDLLGGTQSALSGLLVALLAAARTGRGRFVDVSMTHEVWRHQALARSAMAAEGGACPVPGAGLVSGGAPCYAVYRCADGRHLAVGALELKFWRTFCTTVGRPEWADQHWTLGQPPGSERARAQKAEVAAWLSNQTLAHWWALLEPADCCVTPVLHFDEVAGHPLFT